MWISRGVISGYGPEEQAGLLLGRPLSKYRNFIVINGIRFSLHTSKILSRVFQGSTDAYFFEDFIEELLEHRGKYPEPKSVIIMDNASFHRSERIEHMCREKGVKLVYLPPYSPDLNPIEDSFAEMKAFIRRHWQSYEDKTGQGFDNYLEWCIDQVGAKENSAHGHSRHAGLNIEVI